MNAVTTKNHQTNKFKWLLKREFWENRGGFLWAPLITGAIICILTAIFAVIGLVRFKNSGAESDLQFSGDMAEHARQIGGIGDTALLVGISLTILVLSFVVFFYALGVVLSLIGTVLLARMLMLWSSFGYAPELSAIAMMFSYSTGLQCIFFAMWMDMEVNKDLK